MAKTDFTDVTEMAGEEISSEQLWRLTNRYRWAQEHARNKDVIEVACGTGPGLGMLAEVASSVKAGDFSSAMVAVVQDHYGDRIEVAQYDAQAMPYEDNSADVILIFEALYYIRDASKFVEECVRVLRPGGKILVSNANSDLFDFNPSPHSFVYHGVEALGALFSAAGFETRFMGSAPLTKTSLKQKIVRPIKKCAVSLGLMPKTMAGKRLLKRLVFGSPVRMPAELTPDMAEHETPMPIPADQPNFNFKVIFCEATLPADSAALKDRSNA